MVNFFYGLMRPLPLYFFPELFRRTICVPPSFDLFSRAFLITSVVYLLAVVLTSSSFPLERIDQGGDTSRNSPQWRRCLSSPNHSFFSLDLFNLFFVDLTFLEWPVDPHLYLDLDFSYFFFFKRQCLPNFPFSVSSTIS